MLTQERGDALLIQAGALIEGHFRLASGLHSNRYADKDSVTVDTDITEVFCGDIAQHFHDWHLDVVVGPAYGAIVGAHDVARLINLARKAAGIPGTVKAVFAHRNDDGKMVIRKSMVRHLPGKNCLVVEDILTTGGSARETVQASLAAGAAAVLAVGAFCNRGGVTKEQVGLPDGELYWAHTLEGFLTYAPEDCPMCKAGMEISRQYGRGPAV